MNAWKRHVRTPILWLAILYVLTGLAYIWVTPGLEKPDEQDHYGYVRYLREHRALPPLTPWEEWLFESKQPPLYYAIVALGTAPWEHVPDPFELVVENPYRDLSVPTLREDNRNVYLHPPHLTPVIFGGRLVSLIFGLGTLLSAYAMARQLFPRSRWIALASAAVVGFQPKFLFIATALSNDAATAFFGTTILALLLRQWRHPDASRTPVYVGLLAGLASLTKVSALVFFPLIGISLLFIHRGLNRKWLRDVAIIGAVALAIGGWWYLRNAILYQDPFTLNAHLDRPSARLRPLLERLPTDLRDIERTLWGNQSRLFIRFTRLDTLALWWGRLSLIAGAVALIRRRKALAQGWTVPWVLLIWPLTFFLLLVFFWTREHSWAHARFLIPAIAPLMILLLGSWYVALPNPRWRKPVLGGSAAFFIILGVLSPWLLIYPLYHPATPLEDEAVEYPTDILFQDEEGRTIATLVGFTTPEDQTTPGSYVPVEVCWIPEEQTEIPYAVFVQLIDLSPLGEGRSPVTWGRRETYPGLGSLPTDRWDTEESFCSTVFVWVYDDVPTPVGAFIEIGLFDPETGHRLQPMTPDGHDVPFTAFRGIAILETEASSVIPADEADYVFDNSIGLYDLDASLADETLVVTTTFQCLDTVSYEAFLFVKVWDENGELAASADRPPLDGRYPTYYWVPGSWVTEVITLDVGSGAGLETLSLGMYTWPDVARLPVVNARGEPMQNHVIRLPVADLSE